MLNLLGLMVVVLLIGPLLLIAVGGLLLLTAALLRGSPRRLRETFRCPWTKRVVTADFLVPEGAAHPSEVASCTAFREREQVTCEKPCLELAELGWGLARAVFPRWALTAGGLITWRSPTVSLTDPG